MTFDRNALAHGPTLARTRRAFGLGLFALLLAGAALAQPKAKAETLVHDFGVMPRGETASHTFILRNEGDEDLLIEIVRASCACTVVDHPDVIKPGENGEIRIDLDTMLLNGPSSKNVSLYTNDPAAARIDLTVKADSRPYIDVFPGYFRYIVVQGFTDEATIKQTVLASSPKEFSVVAVEAPVPFIDVSFREATAAERDENHDGPQWIVEATLAPDAPVGPLSGYIEIVTDHARQKKASIPLSGFVRPVFAVTPTEADFGVLALEEPRLTALDVRRLRHRRDRHHRGRELRRRHRRRNGAADRRPALLAQDHRAHRPAERCVRRRHHHAHGQRARAGDRSSHARHGAVDLSSRHRERTAPPPLDQPASRRSRSGTSSRSHQVTFTHEQRPRRDPPPVRHGEELEPAGFERRGHRVQPTGRSHRERPSPPGAPTASTGLSARPGAGHGWRALRRSVERRRPPGAAARPARRPP